VPAITYAYRHEFQGQTIKPLGERGCIFFSSEPEHIFDENKTQITILFYIKNQ
jgi:hypothetical protein